MLQAIDQLSWFLPLCLLLLGLTVGSFLNVLIYRPPKVTLLAVETHEDFINVEGAAVSSMPTPQSKSV